MRSPGSPVSVVDESEKVIYATMRQMWKAWIITDTARKSVDEPTEINGEGADERMSSTLSEKTMYYAVRLENGNVLRVSGRFGCNQVL